MRDREKKKQQSRLPSPKSGVRLTRKRRRERVQDARHCKALISNWTAQGELRKKDRPQPGKRVGVHHRPPLSFFSLFSLFSPLSLFFHFFSSLFGRISFKQTAGTSSPPRIQDGDEDIDDEDKRGVYMCFVFCTLYSARSVRSISTPHSRRRGVLCLYMEGTQKERRSLRRYRRVLMGGTYL